MSNPCLPLQAAIRARLVASPSVTSIIPASAILDRNATPALDNSIVIGEGLSIRDNGIARDRRSVVMDLHIWRKEPGTVGSKQAAGAVEAALDEPLSVAGFHVIDFDVVSVRFLRDPGGEHSHAVVSVECRTQKVA